jgi:hypothetical protein
MTNFRPLLFAFLAAATAAQAQDPDISHQRQLYRKINAGAAAKETRPGAAVPVAAGSGSESSPAR